jgi:hypothetical protein
MLMGRMQRKWESRIRNRNFWARCSCNRVILHSCRGSGREGSGTGISGLAAPATELSFIHAEEMGEQDQEQEFLGSLLLQQSYPIFKQNMMQRGSFYLDTSPHDEAVNIATPHPMMQQFL